MSEDRNSAVFGEAMLRLADARLRREIAQPDRPATCRPEAADPRAIKVEADRPAAFDTAA